MIVKWLCNILILNLLLSCSYLRSQTTIASGFNSPFEIAIQNDTAYIGEFSSSLISSIDLSITNPPILPVLTNFNSPTVIVFDNSEVYLGQVNGVITKRSATDFSENIQTIFVNAGPVVGIAINGNDLYFSEFLTNGRIQRIDLTNLAAGAQTIATGLNNPEQIALVGDELYVACRGSGSIEKLDISLSNPVPTTVVSNLNNPSGLHLIGTTLYITESQAGGQILSMNTTQTNPTLTTVASGLDTPFGIDSYNNSLYVVLRGSSSVVSFTLPNTCAPFLNLSNIESSDTKTEEAINYITSNSTITGTANITYHAGDYIEMTPGFSVESGAVFESYILGCSQ